MACNKYYLSRLKLDSAKKRWLKVNSTIKDTSGIYILHRTDEVGIKYAYVGQAKHVLTRLGQHLLGYQHIDLSLKKHKLFNQQTNFYGWSVCVLYYPEEELDEQERHYIKAYANAGYQMRNKTSGGQNEGKTGIDDIKSSKGYYDGLKQGYKNCIKDIKIYFIKYLDFVIKEPSKNKDGTPVAIKEKKYNEFSNLLKEVDDDGTK